MIYGVKYNKVVDTESGSATSGETSENVEKVEDVENVEEVKEEEVKGTKDDDTGITSSFNPNGDSVTEDDNGKEANEEEVDDSSSKDEEQDTNKNIRDFNGVPLEIHHDDGIVSSLTANGFDVDKIDDELFSKEGLSQETRDKLNKSFGKSSVDMYLDGWKAKNELASIKHTKAAEVTNSVVTEVLGNEQNLKYVVQWANDNLSPEEYKSYQELINSGNRLQMSLGLRELSSRSGLTETNKDDKESPKINDVNPRSLGVSTSPSSGSIASDAMLSPQQYNDLFIPDDNNQVAYFKNPEKYDMMLVAWKENNKQ